MNLITLSRIQSPCTPTHLLSRKRLTNRLIKGKEKKLILICSPAGYGKTTLILDYLKTADIRYAWINISDSIDHLYSFYIYIINSYRQLSPSFGSDSIELLKSLYDRNSLVKNINSSIQDITVSICRELKKTFNEPVALVLDDYHHIENTDWKDLAVDTLIKNLPADFQLIITSRQLPDIDIPYYIGNDMIIKLEMEQLLFNEAEIEELVSLKYNLNASREKIKEIRNKLKGWITGLHLMLQGYGNDLNNIQIHEQLIPENIFNDLADKILEMQDAEVREFLVSTSVIENFHKELCEEVFDVQNFDDLIGIIEKNIVLLYNTPLQFGDKTEYNSYNYVQLLRNYLKSRLQNEKTGVQIKDIYRKTYSYYLKKDDILTAVGYMIEAGDNETALKHIDDNFSELFEYEKIEFLWNWYSRIDRKLIEKSAGTLSNFGKVNRFYTGDLKSSLMIYELAAKKLTGHDDKKTLTEIYTNKALISMNMGDIKKVIDELTDLTEKYSDNDTGANFKYYLAYAYFLASDYNSSAEILKDTLENANSAVNKQLVNNIHKVLGHIYLIKGEYYNAIKNYDKIIFEQKNIFDRIEILFNMILLCSQSGEYPKAEEHMENLDEIMSRYETPVLAIPYLITKQAFYFEQGDFEKALYYMMQIKNKAEELNHIRYLYLAERLITECYYYTNNNQKAVKYYELSKLHIDKNNELKKIELDVTGVLLDTTDHKEDVLIRAYNYYRSNSLLYNLAQVCYYLADFYYKKNCSESRNIFIKECLQLSETYGYVSFLIREYNYNNKLFCSLKDNDYASRIIHEGEKRLANKINEYS